MHWAVDVGIGRHGNKATVDFAFHFQRARNDDGVANALAYGNDNVGTNLNIVGMMFAMGAESIAMFTMLIGDFASNDYGFAEILVFGFVLVFRFIRFLLLDRGIRILLRLGFNLDVCIFRRLLLLLRGCRGANEQKGDQIFSETLHQSAKTITHAPTLAFGK